MIHLTDTDIDALIDFDSAIPVIESSFRQLSAHRAAVQKRVRTQAEGVKLSTMGAVLPDEGIVGAKVYTTIEGHFSFVIVLFSAHDGRPLATLDANALTRVRTAATTVLAVRALARPGARTVAIFGSGVQGSAHAHALAAHTEMTSLRIAGLGDIESLAAELSVTYAARGVEAIACDARKAVQGADVIVTATRATGALFDGASVAPGAFVAAIGSSLPHTRELDDTLVKRAARIVVEMREQAREEAGDLLLAAPGVVQWDETVELGDVLEGKAPGRVRDDDIVLYKAVGIGLQDVALAGLAWRAYQARSPIATSGR
jgi:ornithine cyclodeaminase